MTIQLKTFGAAIIVGIGAAISTFLLTSISIAIAAPTAIALTLGSLIIALLVARSLQSSYAKFDQQLTAGFVNEYAPTNVIEFDQTAEACQQHIRQWRVSAETSNEEIEKLKQLATMLDRRGHAGTKSTGNTKLIENLIGGYASEIESGIRQIESCGREIERGTGQIAEGTDQQSDAVNRCATLVEKISLQIDDVLQRAESSDKLSKETTQHAENGLQHLQSLVRELSQIKTLVASREKRLRALGDHTREIGVIVETIGTLSSRTDLLALNASIESVRAGEHGRGFALVAEEVRTLAEQAAAATRDVAARIESIQSETQNSISVIESENNQIQEAIELSSKAFELVEKIDESTETSGENVSQIWKASEQQLQLAQEFIENMQTLSETTRSGRSQIEGVRWTTKSLSKFSQQLQSVVTPLKFGKSIPDSNKPIEQRLDETQDLVDSAC